MENTKNEFLNFPSSYYKNSQEEEKILYLANNFQRQFQFLHPQRPSPPLYLENEFKVRKIICTSLCPFKVNKSSKLRDWQDCASFIADFIEYDVLEFPTKCPEELYSLDTMLKRRRGNSLGISMILTTVLLSSDIDAYIVQGYATRDVTKKIERDKTDPPLLLKFSHFGEAKNLQSVNAAKKNKYYLDFSKAKDFWMEGKTFEEAEKPKIEYQVREKKDVLFGKRVHFWVLIQLVENGEKQPFFLESTTGEKIPLDDPNYLGIEFVWNNRNFWCNNQNFFNSCKEIKFDFHDCSKWQAFLPEYSLLETPENENFHIRMPETWLTGIQITQKDVENKYPLNGKHVQYKTAEVYTYNPQTMEDGLVYRVIYYQTDELKIPVKNHSFFNGRADNLDYRFIDFTKEIVKEYFSIGRKDALKEHKYHIEDDQCFLQTMTFYSQLREDRLGERSWNQSKTTDSYVDRSDFLFKREVTYETNSTFDVGQMSSQQNENSGTERTSFQNVETPTNSNKEVQHQKEENSSVLNKSKMGIAKTDFEDFTISPSSFDNCEPILEDIDFANWSFHNFIESIVPAERYATSESDSENELFKTADNARSSNTKDSKASKENLRDKQNIKDEKVSEDKVTDKQKVKDEIVSDENVTGKQKITDEKVPEENATDNQNIKEDKVLEANATDTQNIKDEKVSEKNAANTQKIKKEKVSEEILTDKQESKDETVSEKNTTSIQKINDEKVLEENATDKEKVKDGNVSERNARDKQEINEEKVTEENAIDTQEVKDEKVAEENATDKQQIKDEKVLQENATDKEKIKNENVSEGSATDKQTIKDEKVKEENATDKQEVKNELAPEKNPTCEYSIKNEKVSEEDPTDKQKINDEKVLEENVTDKGKIKDENISRENVTVENKIKVEKESEENATNTQKINDDKVSEENSKDQQKFKEEMVSEYNATSKQNINDEKVLEGNSTEKEKIKDEKISEETATDKQKIKDEKVSEESAIGKQNIEAKKVSEEIVNTEQNIRNEKVLEKNVTDKEKINDEKVPEGNGTVEQNIKDQKVSQENLKDNGKAAEAEFDKELEIYEELNFDALSDEELETDYQIYLSKLWNDYTSSRDSKLFYMEKTFQDLKDMGNKEILHLKKKVIRKRRLNTRYLQRKMGKPAVRVYKRKSEEKGAEGQYTNALMSHLNLKGKVAIGNVPDVNEFYIIKNLEEKYIADASEEIIKNESMELLDKRLKENSTSGKLFGDKRILSIKHSYLKDPSCPLVNSISCVWFLFESSTYRIDFHHPEGMCTSRTVIFTKPECESTEFAFSDYLCRQIIPSYEMNKISRPRLYIYLVGLLKKEAFVLRENTIIERDMKQLLAKRKEEMKELDTAFKTGE